MRTIVAPAVALLMLVIGCAAPGIKEPVAPEGAEPVVTIRGSLAFRNGATPPPGSIATVMVREFPATGDSNTPLSATTMEVGNPHSMLPFELSVPASKLDRERQYAVTATVSARPDGDAQWTTDFAQLIDATRQESDTGVLLMRRLLPGRVD